MKVIAFGASTSRESINKRFVTYAVKQLAAEDSTVLDLNDYSVPIFSIDEEKENGIPSKVIEFYNIISSADLLLISLAEHNGSFTAAFKNLFDWTSRHELNMFENSKLALLSTAPGARGGLGVMAAALDRFPRHKGEVLANFSLPKFYDNFNDEFGLKDESLKASFDQFISAVKSNI